MGAALFVRASGISSYKISTTGRIIVDAGAGAGENEMVANIDRVRGATYLTGSFGQNTYHFHDATVMASGLVYTLLARSLYRTDSSGNNKTGEISFLNPYSVRVDGGGGGNTYLVKQVPPTSGGKFSLFTGNGKDRVTVERASSPFEIDLQGGDDELTFVSPGNSPNYAAKVIGGAGTDSVVYDDRLVTTPQQYLVTPTSLGRAASPINVETIENIEVTGGSSDDTFSYAGTIPGGIVNFQGAAGSDTLDLSRFTKNVVIDLVSQTATDITLMSSFENAIGGAGNDQLLGAGGANLLDGRGGRDLIIGGLGVDTIMGGEGDDLLLAGSTSHAASAAALGAIMAEWTRTDATYADRVTHLLTGGGLNGSTLLNRQTYTADPSANTLRGNADLDLFFGSLARDTHDRSLDEGEVFIDSEATQFSVQLNATAVMAGYLYLDSKTFDPKAAFNIDLTTGAHTVNIGGYAFNFIVTADGRIEYAAALEGLVSGLGTSSLRINGAQVMIDATAITSNSLGLDYMQQDKSMPLTVRLMPGQHFIESPTVIFFSVTESGKIEYDASQEGVLLGNGTNQLLVRGAAVTIDARALWSSNMVLDYLTVDKHQVLNARLLPGQHFIQTNGGDVLWFNVAANGQVSYDASLEGTLTGSGTTELGIPGLQVTIDPTLSTASYFTLNYSTSDARTPTPFALTPGSHFIVQAGEVHWFTVSKAGIIDYDPSLDTFFSGRGTRTLTLLV
jgi:Ca2+-binding RTX toxin-like protein